MSLRGSLGVVELVGVVAIGLGLAGCPDDAVNKLTDAPPLADTPIDAPVCVAPTGAGTMHQSITAPETWTAAASPHVIPFDINIAATVTIEPCAVVRIAVEKGIDMPISSMVARLVGTEVSVAEAARELMTRPLKQE